jgi:ABC-type sugar transport system substrate-binding protein
MRRSSATKAVSRLVAVLALSAGTVALPVSAVAAAASPPIVSTGSASNVTFSSAVLHGSINARGLATNFAFQYGTSKRYDAQTPLVT